MPVTPFSAGRFSSATPVVEWDGTNHQDILNWIHELDTYGLDQVWTISAVSATEVTFTLPPTSLPPEQLPPAYGNADGRDVTLAVGDWLSATPVAPAYDGPPAWLVVTKINKAGMWKTTDPYGRPTNLNDLLAPGGSTDPDPDPVLAPPTIAGSVDAQRRALVTGQVGATGTAAAIQIHELRKYPDATLKATVTPDAQGGFSRLSGTLQPFVLEYAARSVAADGTLSKFSNTIIVTITESGGTVAPGQPAGWDTSTPPDPDPNDPGTDPDDPGTDPDTDPPVPPTTTPSIPWTQTFRDGSKYAKPTGGDGLTAGIVSTASALPTISSNATITYTGPALTSLVTITGKSNFTLKGVKLASGGKLVIKDCSNYWLDDCDLQYEPSADSGAGDLVALRGTGTRAGVRNSVFGPATYSEKTAVTSTVQFLAVLDAMDHVYLEKVTFRNKSTPGNAFRIYGDYTATGGCQYSVSSQVLWDRAEPYRENDQEMARFGTSQMMQTNGHHIVEFSRIQNVATEPELLSFKMNFSTCRGSTFVDCVGSPVFRHGNDGEIHDCYMVGDRTATAPNSSTVRTSAGFRGYGARHKAHHLTIRVNGTSKYERAFLLDEGDTSPDALSNGHANVVDWDVSNILLVKCGSPFTVGANYSNPPAGCKIRDSWVVECADAGTTGLKVDTGGSASGVTLQNVQVFGTVAAAGLAQGASGEWKAPAGVDRGARTPYITAAMAGKGATWDPWAGLSSGGGNPPTNPTASTAAERYGWGTPHAKSDEFNYVGTPDATKWKLPGPDWLGHNENGTRDPERVTVDGSKLIMTGLASGSTGWMQHLLDQEGGRWEVRLRAYPGAPSAGEPDATSNGRDYHVLALLWPQSNSRQTDGEFDFVETGQPGAQIAEGYNHYPHPWTSVVQQEHWEKPGVDQTQFHNYAIEYKRGPDGYIRNYIDGVLVNEDSGGAISGTRRDIQDMPAGHLCLQLDNFDGSDITPATVEVEWVRVYPLANTSTPPVNPPTTGVTYPADLIPDHWKLTLPLWNPNDPSKVWEIIKDGSPDLDTYSGDYFRLNAAKTGIEMIAFYEGAHTPNSTNVRSELREMTANGLSLAGWSTNSGNHKLVVVTQIDKLEGNHVVTAQIHGGDDDVTVFRLEGSTLWLTDGDTAHGKAIMTDYVLGTPLAIGFHVAGGNCDYYMQKLTSAAEAVAYDPNALFVPGNRRHSLAVSDSSCYFKAGNYLQRKGSPGSKTQVTLYKATVAHY